MQVLLDLHLTKIVVALYTISDNSFIFSRNLIEAAFIIEIKSLGYFQKRKIC